MVMQLWAPVARFSVGRGPPPSHHTSSVSARLNQSQTIPGEECHPGLKALTVSVEENWAQGACIAPFLKKKEMEDGPGIILSELGALCACLCTADLPFQLYLIKILNVNLKCAHSLSACLLMENKSQAGIRFMPNNFLVC